MLQWILKLKSRWTGSIRRRIRPALFAVCAALAAQGALAGPANPYISEFLAKNEHGLRDEFGQPQDWIEIHNPTALSVNLQGWSLSDDADEPGKWIFPDIALAPGAYRVVFASGDSRTPTDGAPLHANFKLDKDGDYLGLFPPGPEPVAACEFAPAYPPQTEDISYGWDDARMEFRYFSAPTPGQPNDGLSFTAVAPAPVFSHLRGLYKAPFELELTTTEPDAEIYYTLYGQEPTTKTAILYSGPIAVEETRFVRARVFKNGLKPSPIITHSYLLNVDITHRSIAIISIVGDSRESLYEPNGVMAIVGGRYDLNGFWGQLRPEDYNNPMHTGREFERPVSVEWFGAPVAKPFQVDCGLRVHGSEEHRKLYRRLDNWNTRESKFSLRLYFRDEYGPAKLDYPLFADSLCPVDRFDQLVIRGGRSDFINPFIRDEFIRRVSLDMGQLAPRGTYAVLYINGWYKHYFNLTQRVTSEFLNASWNKDSQWDIMGEYQMMKEGTDDAWDALMYYLDTHDLANGNAFRYVAHRVDLINFIDYLILNVYMANADWMANWLVVRERTPSGQFKFIAWDTETSVTSKYLTKNLFEESPFYGQPGGLNYNTSQDMTKLYQALHSSAEFRLMFADRIRKHFSDGGALTPEKMLDRHDECYRWIRPLIGSAMETSLRDVWLPQREPYVMEHFRGAGLMTEVASPDFSSPGGVVNPFTSIDISNNDSADAVIYITTDGSDPRVPLTEEIAPSAKAFDAPLQLDRYTRLRARALKDGLWSAMAEADYLTADTEDIFVTEIMADPKGEDEFGEWFELYNATSRPINIDGWTICDNSGQRHVIDNGGSLIVPSDGHLILGKSSDRAVNGDVPVDYAYGINFRLGDNADEIILMQGPIVTASLGYGDFATAPTYIQTRLTTPPGKGVAIGMTGTYYLGATQSWAEQTTPCGADGNLATPGQCNDGGIHNGAETYWPLYH